MPIERLSIELTQSCTKGCAFCYNASTPLGQTSWTPDSLVSFVTDCAAHGTRAVSLGGGEPMEFEGLHDVLERLDGVVFRSMTTHGLLLRDPEAIARLAAARPDKVHVSIHDPRRQAEVRRVKDTVLALERAGIPAGVNLLVASDTVEQARDASALLRDAGIAQERIVYLPMRAVREPTPEDVARAAGDAPFQSMSCLTACARSPRFCSITHDQRVAWCSFTATQRPIHPLSASGLRRALTGLGLTYCGTTPRVELRP